MVIFVRSLFPNPPRHPSADGFSIIKKVKEKVSYYFSGQSILTHQQSASRELTACNFGLIIRLAKEADGTKLIRPQSWLKRT